MNHAFQTANLRELTRSEDSKRWRLASGQPRKEHPASARRSDATKKQIVPAYINGLWWRGFSARGEERSR